MERSTVFALSCLIGINSSLTYATPEPFEADVTGLHEPGIVPLSVEEMEATRGEFIHIPFFAAFSIFGGGVIGTSVSAINQYQNTGSVNIGQAALAGLGGAAITAVNVGAAATGSVVLITTAVGLDIAASVALAVADTPTSSPDYTPNITNYQQQENGSTLLGIDNVDYTLPPQGTVVGGIAELGPPVTVVNHNPIADISSGGGAGDEQLLYF